MSDEVNSFQIDKRMKKLQSHQLKKFEPNRNFYPRGEKLIVEEGKLKINSLLNWNIDGEKLNEAPSFKNHFDFLNYKSNGDRRTMSKSVKKTESKSVAKKSTTKINNDFEEGEITYLFGVDG